VNRVRRQARLFDARWRNAVGSTLPRTWWLLPPSWWLGGRVLGGDCAACGNAGAAPSMFGDPSSLGLNDGYSSCFITGFSHVIGT
jgi:hypothetical protein